MTTANQKTVAEALHLAHTVSFGEGFMFFHKNIKGDSPDNVKLAWFVRKCVEHDIRKDELSEEAARMIASGRFSALAEEFRKAGVIFKETTAALTKTFAWIYAD